MNLFKKFTIGDAQVKNFQTLNLTDLHIRCL